MLLVSLVVTIGTYYVLVTNADVPNESEHELIVVALGVMAGGQRFAVAVGWLVATAGGTWGARAR